MTNLKDMAEQYEGKTTKLVSDLPRIRVDLEVEQRTFKEGTPDEFTVDVVTIDSEDYRIPASVLIQLKMHLETIGEGLKYIQVLKTGEGLKGTKYTVVPLKDEK